MKYDTTINATGFKNVCWQFPKLNNANEDCLFLNIYTPKQITRKLEVMIWVHGGSFKTGSGQMYNGSNLASSQDLIVVTINYRLGIFGFLDQNEKGEGNLGLFD